MNGLIASLDLVSLLSLAICCVLISLPAARKALGKEVAVAMVLYFACGLFYQVSITLEWTGVTNVLDPYEDYIQLFQPLLLIFFLYSFTRGRAAADKSEEEKRHQMLFNASADAIFFQRIEGRDGNIRCIDVNKIAVKILGYSRDEYLRTGLYNLCAPNERNTRHAQLLALRNGERIIFDEVFIARDGHAVPVEMASQRYAQAGHDLIISAVRDMTAQRRMENEVRHSQRMESVGRLAGGIAHDFNNILTVITGYSDLMLNAMSDDNELREDAAEIRRAAGRAVSLTKQLLAFSRKQVLQPKLISPGDIINQAELLLKRLIGEDVELQVECIEDGARFLGDPSQVEQVIMNLAVNARDAMPGGGTLRISTLR